MALLYHRSVWVGDWLGLSYSQLVVEEHISHEAGLVLTADWSFIQSQSCDTGYYGLFRCGNRPETMVTSRLQSRDVRKASHIIHGLTVITLICRHCYESIVTILGQSQYYCHNFMSYIWLKIATASQQVSDDLSIWHLSQSYLFLYRSKIYQLHSAG